MSEKSNLDIEDLVEEFNNLFGLRVDWITIVKDESEMLDICSNQIGEVNIEYTDVINNPGITSQRLVGYNRWFWIIDEDLIKASCLIMILYAIFLEIGNAPISVYKERILPKFEK